MPPKRKAAAKTRSAGKGKKAKVKDEVKEEPIQAPDRFESAKQALKASSGKKGKAKVDASCPLNQRGDCEVFEDYDCMLNQTNIGHNNNKFYIIQLLSDSDNFYCWNRWGRVGEVGQSKLNSFNDPEPAIKDFEKKFRDKTKNAWSDREKFTPHPGKYTLIEVEHDDEEDGGAGEVAVKVDKVDGVCKKVRPCSLDKPTQELMSLIFSADMFKEAMQTMNLDIKKMPLGKLSKAQIAKGFEALEELQDAPLDVDYELLKCGLDVLDTSSDEYKIIQTYVKQTGPTYQQLKILNVWTE